MLIINICIYIVLLLRTQHFDYGRRSWSQLAQSFVLYPPYPPSIVQVERLFGGVVCYFHSFLVISLNKPLIVLNGKGGYSLSL